MNIFDAFLSVTALTFFTGAVYPKSVTFFSRSVEKLAFLAQGAVLTAALLINNTIFWAMLGVAWTPFIGLDYVGTIKYRVLGGESMAAQVFMTAWDLLIAVACMVKV